MEAWTQLISTLGFPIVTALACAYFIYKIWAKEQDQMERREKDNLDIITRLSSVLSENSKALLKNSEMLERISDKLTSVEEKVEEVQKDVSTIKIKQDQDNK